MKITAYICLGVFITSLANSIQALYILDAGFTATELGLLLSAITFSFLASDILLSYIFDNKSRRTSISLGHILVGAFCFVMVQADSPEMLIFAGLLVGIANACFFGAMQAIYIENTDGDMQTIMGRMGVYIGVVGILSLGVGTATAYYLGFKPLYTIMGWLNVLVAPFAFVFLPKNRETASFSIDQFKADFHTIYALYFGDNKSITSLDFVLSLTFVGITSYWLYFIFGENSATDNILMVSGLSLIFKIFNTSASYMIKELSQKMILMLALCFIGVSVFVVFPVLGENYTMDLQGKIQFVSSMVLVYMGLSLFAGLHSVYFQRIISDRLRATSSSFVGFIKSALTTIFVPIMGLAVTNYGYLPFVAMYAITAVAGVLFVIAMLKKT